MMMDNGSIPVAILRRHLNSFMIVLIVLVSCSLDRIDSWTPDVLTKSYITYGECLERSQSPPTFKFS